ncbi:hypothetical protein AB1Y20_005256 [Prymnesium parvum]
MSATSVGLKFDSQIPSDATTTILVGRKQTLLSAPGEALPTVLPQSLWAPLVGKASNPGDMGGSASTLIATSDGPAATVVAAVLPEPCSRHNSPFRPHAMSALVASPANEAAAACDHASIVVVLDDAAHAGGAACAIARAFPLYSRKKSSTAKKGGVTVSFFTKEGPLPAEQYPALRTAADGVRLAARLVDMPAEELTTTAFVAEAAAVTKRLQDAGHKIISEVISGEALRDGGYGGLWNVGKAAEEPPALVVLSYVPENPAKTVCLVGKGIVYDTGGLGLKSKEGMCGMKADCGGAAALLAAFEAAVASGLGGDALHVCLCLAENAIGPAAFRHDDIICFLSGKTCEINNTDAEGRLVLSDGVAHASHRPPKLPGVKTQPDLIIDMATLTGAQLVATGKRHAAIVTNDEQVEIASVAAGKLSGDLVHPLPYCPEFFRKEFKSQVADMKNSVKDRSNAQSSCAANFIHENLNEEFSGSWLHVDMAGPAFVDDRATGFGVAFVLALLGVAPFKP